MSGSSPPFTLPSFMFDPSVLVLSTHGFMTTICTRCNWCQTRWGKNWYGWHSEQCGCTLGGTMKHCEGSAFIASSWFTVKQASSVNIPSSPPTPSHQLADGTAKVSIIWSAEKLLWTKIYLDLQLPSQSLRLAIKKNIASGDKAKLSNSHIWCTSVSHHPTNTANFKQINKERKRACTKILQNFLHVYIFKASRRDLGSSLKHLA